MLLRRHKINSVRQGTPDNIVEDAQQEQLYGDELQYKEKENAKEDEGKYTRTSINRMSKSELQELAINSGVECAEDMTGSQLKDYLINLFGL